jgi:hypothetical protein
VLHALFFKAERLGKSPKMFHAVCIPHDVLEADRSPHRLLLLYGVTYSEMDYEEAKLAGEVPKYTIGNSSSD